MTCTNFSDSFCEKNKSRSIERQRRVILLAWQDIITIIAFVVGNISFVIGLVGFILTVFTLKKAGSIEMAIKQTKAEQINKIKYINRKDSLIDTLNRIRNKLIGNTCSKRSSGEIQHIFLSAEEVVLNLLECSEHLSNKHKNDIVLCKEFISQSLHGEHILDCDDCNTLREYIVKIIVILSQEEYFV